MKASLTLVALFAPALAFAQPGGVNISRSATLNASGGSATAVSLGVGTRARVSEASVARGVSVNGDAALNASVRQAGAFALGAGSQARTYAGSITSGRYGGSVSATGVARSINAIALTPYGGACAAVGAVAGGSGGSVRTYAQAKNVVAYNIGPFSRPSVNIGSVGRPC